MNNTRYDYEFSLWIDGNKVTSQKLIPKAVEIVRRALCRTSEENITSQEFSDIRENLWHLGFELHEITRKIHLIEEIVL